MDFTLNMMDSTLNMMDFTLQMMDFTLKMMGFTLKMLDWVKDIQQDWHRADQSAVGENGTKYGILY